MFIQNKAVSTIFRTLYLLIGFVGILASVGIFDGTLRDDWYLPFTHLSNYACIGIVAARLIGTVRHPQRTVNPLIPFMGLEAILLTFTVFHFVLAPAPNRDPALNTSLVSVLFHLVLPLMYTAGWMLFSKHGTCRWYYPLVSVLSPLVYVMFVYIRAALFSFDSTRARLYPYFFLDINTRSIPTVAMWMALILVGYLVMGYALFGLDRLLGNRSRYQL